MFEVSRVSVREAIVGLEAMGAVSVQHGRGCFVAEATRDRFSGPFGDWLKQHHDQMVELLKVRGALDGLAAFETAQIGDQTVLKKLESIHKSYGTLVGEKHPSLDRLVALDVRFHGAIAEGSHSALLSDLLTELNTHIADSRRLTFLSKGQPQRSWNEHSGIIDAIRRHDADDAENQAIRHIHSVLERMDSDS
jgi:DNA-binding FadR family transcriptional regulator